MSNYYTDINNEYQYYSSSDTYSQYILVFESTNSVSKAGMLNYLAKTRARRTSIALDQDFSTSELLIVKRVMKNIELN